MTIDSETIARPGRGHHAERSAWRDQQRLAELHDEFGGRLVAFLTARTGDRDLARDLTQDTMLRAADHLEQLSDDRPVWPWLKTVASNLVVDHHRKHGREHLTDDLTIYHQTDRHDPIEVCLERDLLTEALDQLNDRHRLAIELRYLEQWKAAEACELFGLTRAAFEQLLFRARTNLRDAYQALADQPARLAGLLLAPIARLKTSLATRLRARLAGWDHTPQSMGPALEAIGQAAATIALIGLAAATIANGGSPASADTQLRVAGSNSASDLETLFDAPGGSSPSVQHPGISARIQETRADTSTADEGRTVAVTSPESGIDDVAAEGEVSEHNLSTEGSVTLSTTITTIRGEGRLVYVNCAHPRFEPACEVIDGPDGTDALLN